ncbi:MAG: DUF3341 domain-containing protein, partial [Bacteroidales bacterium]|nr:DUF3341 domain-containing protein [Bacteroidales bacterium]
MKKRMILGVFGDEDQMVSAVRSLQEQGVQVRDVVSPFPVHKVFDLLKLKTRLPVAAFSYAVFALVATFAFLYWTSVVNYPLVFGGKPQNTLSFIIVIFVMVINITAVFTI